MWDFVAISILEVIYIFSDLPVKISLILFCTEVLTTPAGIVDLLVPRYTSGLCLSLPHGSARPLLSRRLVLSLLSVEGKSRRARIEFALTIIMKQKKFLLLAKIFIPFPPLFDPRWILFLHCSRFERFAAVS